MIISHHPLFNVSIKYKNIDIYCAHTNLDRAKGGTTDTLIKTLGLSDFYIKNFGGEFTRYIDFQTSVQDFITKLKVISPHLRYVNNKGITKLKRIAFCAGSGTEFIQEAFENGADALVTGDLKFHTALDSPIVVFDIGHFESEIMILDVFEKLINNHNGLIHLSYLTDKKLIDDVDSRIGCVNMFNFLFYSPLKDQYFFQPYTYQANTPEKYNREFFIEQVKGGNYQYCAAVMMFDGWQIKSDYPFQTKTDK